MQHTDGGWHFKHDPLHVSMGPYPFSVASAQSFWERVRCPVLLVEGSKSLFRHPKPEAERRNRSFANAERVVLEDVGHMMMRHRPDALAKLLTEFLMCAERS